MTTHGEDRFIASVLGQGILCAAKEGRVREVLILLLRDHMDLVRTPQGQRFAMALAVRINRETDYGEDYIPSGCIPDVIRGGVRRLSDGCYSLSEIMDLAAHHLIWTGEADAVEARLRSGLTVRALLRERYGVVTGQTVTGDNRDRKRFRLFLADAKWRIRKFRADKKRQARRRGAEAWKRMVPGHLM